ncbi:MULTISPECIES: hypothetical protein [Streptomyces]|uniref:Uncharacterized protein n=1 Tax=Streptomyces koyangensis TaxID=188770 RepID=A0A385DHD5_9ACTN|nr:MULTISPECIES: hypothetical protein [Streptomyces]AXQ57798.1 hypothetical protein D0C37_26515 [Streptomyces koyangensis]MCQ9706144.1 hypothetical protein [Streptomyces sp. BSP1]
MSTPEERRYENRVRHLQARQNANLARGPKGVAAVWWDQARVLALRAERNGDPAMWDHLARTLENWCQQAQEREQQHNAQ